MEKAEPSIVSLAMDSRLIFVVTCKLHHKIKWLNPTIENGAWVYVGNALETRKEFIFKCVNGHFTDDELYISWTRAGSCKVPKESIEAAVDDILGIYDFSIWDTKFKRVIEFNKIGIMRLGELET